MLVDSHCHLNYLQEPARCLDRARALDIGGFLCIGVDEEGIDSVLELANSEPDVWASVGQHPQSATTRPDWIKQHLRQPRVVAVGETGLDYQHAADASSRLAQQEVFAYQLDLAAASGLPVVVHSRDARSDTMALMRQYQNVTGVLHCFTESWEMASEALELGWYVSISGIVTFRNADNVRDVAQRLPVDRLLVETDAPWLAPVPHRGKTNEPAFVVNTAHYLADLRGVNAEELSAQTTANFFRLFSRASSAQNSSS